MFSHVRHTYTQLWNIYICIMFVYYVRCIDLCQSNAGHFIVLFNSCFSMPHIPEIFGHPNFLSFMLKFECQIYYLLICLKLLDESKQCSPEQTLHSEASDLGLQYLLRPMNTWVKLFIFDLL